MCFVCVLLISVLCDLQAHDSPVRCMVWSHNDSWMVTGDHAGYVKYWQSNMNNVKMFQAHKEALRGIRYLHLDFALFRFVYIFISILINTTLPSLMVVIMLIIKRGININDTGIKLLS